MHSTCRIHLFGEIFPQYFFTINPHFLEWEEVSGSVLQGVVSFAWECTGAVWFFATPFKQNIQVQANQSKQAPKNRDADSPREILCNQLPSASSHLSPISKSKTLFFSETHCRTLVWLQPWQVDCLFRKMSPDNSLPLMECQPTIMALQSHQLNKRWSLSITMLVLDFA